MIYWSKMPFLKLLLPFAIGIIIGLLQCDETVIYASSISAIILFLVAIGIKNNLEKKVQKGLFIQLTLFSLGLVFINISKQYWLSNYYGKHLKNNSIVFAKILEPVAEKRQSYKTFAEIFAIKNAKQTTSVTGKIVVYFEKNKHAKLLTYGDVVMLKNNIQTLKDAPNPNEFSPKNYLGYRGIYQSCYLHKTEWKKLSLQLGNPIKIYCYKARNYCLQMFRENGLSGDEFAVASAMIVGFEDELKPEIISYFSASGAMHLLSVSGLHIAFVYLILMFILQPIHRLKHGKYFEFIIAVFVLWFYAIVTGFSAPVLRSAIMFSLVVYAKSFEKNLNMFNVLALAGFAILIFDPLSIADVGFQLSFLALLSILLIQPIVSDLFHSKNWFVQKTWEITSVSISATIGTLPFTFYYFHQFPNYFLLVNIVVIPLSTLLLYTGFAAIILSWLPVFPYLLTQALKYVTMFLNYLLAIDEKAPGSITTGIQINEIETIIFFIAIIFFISYLHSKIIKQLIFAMSIFALLLCMSLFFYFPHLKQKKIIVYSVNKHTAIDFFNGQNTILVADTALKNNIIDLRYHIFPNRIRNYISNDLTIDLSTNFKSDIILKKGKFIAYDNRKMVILSDTVPQKIHVQKFKTNYILITNSYNKILTDIDNNYNYNSIILDAALNKKKRNKLIAQLKIKHKKYWDVIANGAFVDSW